MADVTIEQLDGQISLSRQRFSQVIDQIRTVLVEDCKGFVVKASKAAFLEQPIAADKLDDARLASFKKACSELGVTSSQRLSNALGDEALWLGEVGTPSDERSIEDVADVWGHVTAVQNEVKALLNDYGLDGATVDYQCPRYFVGGLYLPTLAEHYWKLRNELRSLLSHKESLAEQTIRSRLESRWNDA